MRTPPSLADFTHARACKPFCEKSLTLPAFDLCNECVINKIWDDETSKTCNRDFIMNRMATTQEARRKKVSCFTTPFLCSSSPRKLALFHDGGNSRCGLWYQAQRLSKQI